MGEYKDLYILFVLSGLLYCDDATFGAPAGWPAGRIRPISDFEKRLVGPEGLEPPTRPL